MAKVPLNYVDENTAVAMLHNAYKPKTLKEYVREKKLPIRTTKIGRKRLYSATDIQTFIQLKSAS